MKTYNSKYGREILLVTHSTISRVWNFIVISRAMEMWPVEIPNILLHVGLGYTVDRSPPPRHCEFGRVMSMALQTLWTFTSYFLR
jgi:hypothetical protein